jgi:hypothetical protein
VLAPHHQQDAELDVGVCECVLKLNPELPRPRVDGVGERGGHRILGGIGSDTSLSGAD